jgi:hypothetical protein
MISFKRIMVRRRMMMMMMMKVHLHLKKLFNFIFNGSKGWFLPSGEKVEDIVAKIISENAKSIKKKKKISATEKATLFYGSSRIIDLSAHMKDWFSIDDRKYMMKNHRAVLQVPEMTGEENSFVTTVENVYAFF